MQECEHQVPSRLPVLICQDEERGCDPVHVALTSTTCSPNALFFIGSHTILPDLIHDRYQDFCEVFQEQYIACNLPKLRTNILWGESAEGGMVLIRPKPKKNSFEAFALFAILPTI